MKYTVVYHTDANKDIALAKKWYKEQASGLEKRFVNAVKQTINYIIENPLLFEVRYKEIRIAFTKVFPFGVHYGLDRNTNTIYILAVLHTSLNPHENWL